MPIIKGEQADLKQGRIVLVYSENPGTGKTLNALLTCPSPMLINYNELQPITDNLNLAKKLRGDTFEYDFLDSDKHKELREELWEYADQAKKGKFPYRSIIVDSLSCWMNIFLRQEIEDQNYKAGVWGSVKERQLVNEARMDISSYGGIASQMNRLLKPLSALSKQGVFVLCTAQCQENPKWDTSLTLAPNFDGQAFHHSLNHYFNFIGLIVPRAKKVKNGSGKEYAEPEFPPSIKFYSPDRHFLCKWNGAYPEKDGKSILPNFLKCDYTRIFGLNDK